MDVYHKVLLKIFAISSGSENTDVDLVDLLKKEGFYSNIDSINDHLSAEGWTTGTAREYTVRITHWGVAEARRALAETPDSAKAIEKQAGRMLADARELVIMLEEFAAGPTKAKFHVLQKRLADVNVLSAKIAGSFD